MLALTAIVAPSIAQAGPPAGFTLRTIAAGFELPTAFAHAPDGRIFVAEKSGRVMVVERGVNRVFLDLRAEVNSGSDGGLLGLVLDPDFAANGRVYVMYTRDPRPGSDRDVPSEEIIASYAPTTSDRNGGDPASQRRLLGGVSVARLFHAGGGLDFDARGRLLASIGDGANWVDVDPRALASQDPDNLAGKVVRIDPVTGAGVTDNPGYEPLNPNSVRSRVIARGLRNPFRLNVDDATGLVYVGDVGWNDWEELNVIDPAGAPGRERNFGWPCFEGGDTGPQTQAGYTTDRETASACAARIAEGSTGPVFARRHGGGNASITGGPVYRAEAFGAPYQGAVFLADYARDEFIVVRPDGGAESFGTAGNWGNPVDIDISPRGTITYAAIAAGTIREIAPRGANQPPTAVLTATPDTGQPPLAARFAGSASSDPDPGARLSYTWDFGDGSAGATGSTATHTYTARGSFVASLTVTDEQGATDTATLPVDVGNTRPTVTIKMRGGDATYRVGDHLPFTISASDPEDGALSGARVTWQVVTHHLEHRHYDATRTGTSGELDTDFHGDDSFLELRATAVDSLAGARTTTLTIRPQTRPLAVVSDPPGAPFVLDGQAHVAPYGREAVIGGTHTLTPPATTPIAGVSYRLADVRDGAAPVLAPHGFAMGDAARMITLRYASGQAGLSPFESGNLPSGQAPSGRTPSSRSGLAIFHLRVTRVGAALRVRARLTRAVTVRVAVEVRVGQRWKAVARRRITGALIAIDVPYRSGQRLRLRIPSTTGSPTVIVRLPTPRRRAG